MKFSKPIKIGFPTNSRIAADCAPLREALEFEGKEGAFTSRFVPDAVFRTARVKDIARFIKDGLYGAGIIGLDTGSEAGLSVNYPSLNKSDIFKLGQPSRLILFAKEENREYFTKTDTSGVANIKKVLTKYPNTGRSALYYRLANPVIFDDQVDGQIESIVANGDMPGVVGGFDVVRTGETIKSYNLVPIVNNWCDSYPALMTKLSTYTRNEDAQLFDVMRALRERLNPFFITFNYSSHRDCDGG